MSVELTEDGVSELQKRLVNGIVECAERNFNIFVSNGSLERPYRCYCLKMLMYLKVTTY